MFFKNTCVLSSLFSVIKKTPCVYDIWGEMYFFRVQIHTNDNAKRMISFTWIYSFSMIYQVFWGSTFQNDSFCHTLLFLDLSKVF